MSRFRSGLAVYECERAGRCGEMSCYQLRLSSLLPLLAPTP